MENNLPVLSREWMGIKGGCWDDDITSDPVKSWINYYL